MKIAICTPVHGDTRWRFTSSLSRLLIHTHRARPDIELDVMMTSSSGLAGNRERLVDLALGWGADWILWADSDQTFPPHSLVRLLAVDRPIVGCSSPKRHRDAIPSATIIENGKHMPVWTTPEKIARNEIEAVSYLGFSLCLVSTKAIRALPRPMFAAENEDMIFFSNLRAAGYHVFVDHALSAEVGHLFLDELTLATSLERKREREEKGGMAE